MATSFFVFDWSGTISDDRRPVYASNLKLLEHFGISKPPLYTFEEFCKGAYGNVVEWLAHHGVHGDHAELSAVYKRYLDEVITEGAGPQMYPNAYDVLEKLQIRGALLGIVSSHPQQNLEHEIGMYGLRPFFTFVIGGCLDKSETLQELLATYALPAQQTLYIGDTVYDIRAAKRAGMPVAAVTTGYHTREKLEAEAPNYLFDSLTHLLTVQ